MTQSTASVADVPVIADPATLKPVETIVILPISLSSGFEVEDPAELEREVYKMLMRKLALKGYVLDRPRNWTRPEDWSAETLSKMTPAELAALSPAKAPYVAFLLVESLDESNKVVSSSAETSVSATLLDRENAKVLWHKRSEGRHQENLLIGFVVMLITPDKYFALEKAFASLFENFPPRPDE